MPKLVVIEGAEAGMQFDLGEATVIGSDVECDVILTDPEVHGRHLKLTIRDQAAAFKDLSPIRSLSVNGMLKGQGKLKHGDILKIGQTVLIYSEDELLDLAPEEGREEAALPDPEPVRRRYESAEAPILAVLGPGAPAGSRDRLATLLRIHEELGSLQEVPKVLAKVLDLVFEVLEPDRAAILLQEGAGGAFRLAATRTVAGREAPGKFPVSRGVLREVFRTREALLLRDAQADDRFAGRESIARQRIRSVLCVPLTFRDEFLGAVALDSSSRPGAFQASDLDWLAVIAFQTALSLHTARLAEQVREKALLEQEIELASKIHQRVLPGSLPERADLELFGAIRPGGGLGGTFYDFEEKGEDLVFSFGEASGKEMDAALVMSMARSMLRSLVRIRSGPREIVEELNRYLTRDTRPDVFLTFLLLRRAAGASRLEYCQAGHDTLLLLAPGEPEVLGLPAGGRPLGSVRGVDEPFREGSLPFPPGAVLLLYSNGLAECARADGARFGLSRLRESLRRRAALPARAVVEGILEDAAAFAGPSFAKGDVTLLVARRKGGA
ncbi:MAG: SpoIIE family protein phosphatase [Planctomycetes bacterium]|nr:SpoIIE family protein phosphatase [Planctomycetota bacterium]